MLDKTLGYILCCQSPGLFVLALLLLVLFLGGRSHKVKSFFRLLLCILQDRLALPLRLVGFLRHLGCRGLDGGKVLVGGRLRGLEYAVYLNGGLGDRAGSRDAERPLLQLLPQRLIFRETFLIPLLLLVKNIQQLRAAEAPEFLIGHTVNARSFPVSARPGSSAPRLPERLAEGKDLAQRVIDL